MEITSVNSSTDIYTNTTSASSVKNENNKVENRNSIMINGLWVNVDPEGEIRRKAYFTELFKQLDKMEKTIRSYYADNNEENLKYDIPYNHIEEKYLNSDSPFYRSDMSKKERQIAYYQETAILWGGSIQLNDPYALASIGGPVDIDKVAKEASQKALDQAKQEMLERVGGESTYEDYFKKFQTMKFALTESGKMGEMILKTANN